MRPMAVVRTSGVPPGVWAKPPLAVSRHDLTYFTQASTSGVEPPMFLRIRIADEVVPRLDSPPALAANPPSGFWSAVTYALVWAISSDVSARTLGARTIAQAARV